ncbi:MAG: hypothetical protein QM753_16035 [Thermomicrobiales bacterium]
MIDPQYPREAADDRISEDKRNSDHLVKIAQIRADLIRQIAVFFIVGILVFAVLFGMFRLTNETTNTTNDVLVSMVQWTIGLTLTLGLALVAYQWLSSNKVIEREREYLQRELDKAVSETLALQSKVAEMLADQQDRTATALSQLERQFRDEAKSDQNYLLRKIETFQLEREELIGSISHRTEELTSSLTALRTQYAISVRDKHSNTLLDLALEPDSETELWMHMQQGWREFSDINDNAMAEQWLSLCIDFFRRKGMRFNRVFESESEGRWMRAMNSQIMNWINSHAPDLALPFTELLASSEPQNEPDE